MFTVVYRLLTCCREQEGAEGSEVREEEEIRKKKEQESGARRGRRDVT